MTHAVATSARRIDGGRIVGVDVARAVALLGMIVAHTMDRTDDTASVGVDPLLQLVAGRSSALFAVLAGVSIALLTQDARRSTEPGRRTAYRWQVLTRALLLALLGLLLGLAGSGVAVILTYYGLLFVLALPVLAWGARRLALLALGWGLLSPVLSTLLRPVLPDPTRIVPSPLSLADPLQLLSELAVTGYYPVLTWGTYLFAGMALGRLDLHRPRTGCALVLGGALLSVAALAVSALVTRSSGVRDALLSTSAADTWPALETTLRSGMFGTFPLGSWWWLLVWSPHTGSVVDLVHTTGTAVLVLGLCLLVTGRSARAGRTWQIAFGAGTMTLTLYSLHVLMLGASAALPVLHGTVLNVVVVLLLGALAAIAQAPGPLEQLVSRASRGVARALTR
ncbi:MAG: DUF1624 domain-containing protein [Actinobacteria bacterium]|nr:DUF1624 domain-containing protein [Actinomycetota bacterium]